MQQPHRLRREEAEEEARTKRARVAGFSDEVAHDEQEGLDGAYKQAGVRQRNRHKDTAELIGTVRPLSNPRKQRLCSHFLKNDCLWGEQCRFSHDPEELRAGAPETEAMNFVNLEVNDATRTLVVPSAQLRFIMTESTRQLLTNASGVSEVSWEPEASRVTLSGTALQVESAEHLLKRVITHCRWGVSEAKVHALLLQRQSVAARLLLAPMVPALKQASFTLNAAKHKICIGSDGSNDVIMSGALISRHHAALEFVPQKGQLYVVDTSTNGTFLNGVRLPSRSSGKVAVFHGDELRFPQPATAMETQEFGYMVNLELMS